MESNIVNPCQRATPPHLHVFPIKSLESLLSTNQWNQRWESTAFVLSTNQWHQILMTLWYMSIYIRIQSRRQILSFRWAFDVNGQTSRRLFNSQFGGFALFWKDIALSALFAFHFTISSQRLIHWMECWWCTTGRWWFIWILWSQSVSPISTRIWRNGSTDSESIGSDHRIVSQRLDAARRAMRSWQCTKAKTIWGSIGIAAGSLQRLKSI